MIIEKTIEVNLKKKILRPFHIIFKILLKRIKISRYDDLYFLKFVRLFLVMDILALLNFKI